MKHIWTVVCSRVITDKDSNNVSLFNILEELTIRGHPQEEGAIPAEMDIVSLWVRNNVDVEEEGFARVTLYAPTGEVLGQWETDVVLTEYLRIRSRLRMVGFPANKSGNYIFRVDGRDSKQQRWRKVAEVPLRIVFSPPDVEEEE